MAEFIPHLEAFVTAHAETWVAVAKTPRGLIPVGLFLAMAPGRVSRGNALWFPWASLRNKLECTLKMALGLEKGRSLLAFVTLAEKEFLNQIARYGLARRVGTIEGAFPDDSPAALFQSRHI